MAGYVFNYNNAVACLSMLKLTLGQATFYIFLLARLLLKVAGDNATRLFACIISCPVFSHKIKLN